MTPGVLTAIAQLSSEKKGDHQHAIKCYTQALQMLDEVISISHIYRKCFFSLLFRIVMNVLKS